jgi:adenylate kinase
MSSKKRKNDEKGSSSPDKKEKRTVRVVCVTGTPGVGKTTICGLVKARLGGEGFEFVNIGDLIKEKKLYSEWDDEMNCSIFDDKLVSSELKRMISELSREGKKGLLIDFHSLGFIPRKLVDHVVVVRTDTERLWTRLEQRGYKESKIKENVEAEIFMESFNEAIDKFGEEKVVERTNNTEQERDKIVEFVCSLLE